ncbi:branched-chain amino acid aminotransferase [Oceanomicrobium pacificus]|uniref:Probable branched-chain-amino-acid aminotransferase n=1 Tax=Oceanomicrobium pacificus TaxID=2692916 RepID=A0A6B0U0U0_9RHOB|nr:branched-chain amino acid aminotransferase [Oceanomicrobium pacificus]MXU66814.1 branched-chain amino acid aminotransferase [Oceanomicrobium pacificus]
MALGSQIVTFYEGRWHEGNAPIIGAADHAAWLGSQVFDGARQFEGVRPDLDLHAERIIRSARAMGMVPKVTADEVLGLMEEGAKKFAPDQALYIRPMMWSREGTPGIIDIDPDSTGFALCLETLPMPEPGNFSLTVSPYCRPRQDMAMTEAKAGSLYANNGRIMADARARGFSNALSLDIDGHVAETASTNVFMVRDGEILTPVPNGTFLNGLTRQRVMKLLAAEGHPVTEASLTVEDFAKADEIWVTGNIAKVMPVARFEERTLPQGPMTTLARELYWAYAHGN